jgi:hypothetical protein
MTHDTDLEEQQEEEGNVPDEPPEHVNDGKVIRLYLFCDVTKFF